MAKHRRRTPEPKREGLIWKAFEGYWAHGPANRTAALCSEAWRAFYAGRFFRHLYVRDHRIVKAHGVMQEMAEALIDHQETLLDLLLVYTTETPKIRKYQAALLRNRRRYLALEQSINELAAAVRDDVARANRLD